jgi:hypothetical protein
VDWTRNAESVTLKLNGGSIHWVPLSSDLRMESTAYSERFYVERAKTTFEMEHRSRLPSLSGWGLSLDGSELRISASLDRGRLVVRWSHCGRERRFERDI